MQSRLVGWWLLAVGAVFVGFAVTGVGFRLQWQQMHDTIQRQSVAPLLDSGTNLKVWVCTPVIELGSRLLDPGFAVFILLVLGNILFWAVVFAFVVRVAFRWPEAGGVRAPAA